MTIQTALAKLIEKQNLSTEEMVAVTRQIMTGAATEAQIGGFLVALRMKGETIDEIAGAAQVMRELCTKVEINLPHLVDTCGTGGDGFHLFNVSTAAAFVVAAAGGNVAKHGNRSVTSSTGSADLLLAAGVNLDLTPAQIARCVQEVGVGFMFAVAHHGAMKHAIGARRELAMRTIFNLLGPMTNPAGVKRQVLGVFHKDLCSLVAGVLQRLGSEHVLVVHSDDGLDEFSLAAPTFVAELKDGEVREYRVTPSEFGIEGQSMEELKVGSAEESLALIKNALGKRSDDRAQKASDLIALNAGAAIYVSGVSTSFNDGVAMAQDAIGSGLALGKLDEMVEFTCCF